MSDKLVKISFPVDEEVNVSVEDFHSKEDFGTLSAEQIRESCDPSGG